MARKASTANTKTKKKQTASKAEQRQVRKMPYELTATITIVVGLVLGILLYVADKGVLGSFIVNSCIFLFGNTVTYIIPLIIIALGVLIFMQHRVEGNRFKFIVGGVLIALSCAVCYYVNDTDGGIFGKYINIPMEKLVGSVATGVILWASLIILIMVEFEISPTKIYNWIVDLIFVEDYEADEEVDHVKQIDKEINEYAKKTCKKPIDFEVGDEKKSKKKGKKDEESINEDLEPTEKDFPLLTDMDIPQKTLPRVEPVEELEREGAIVEEGKEADYRDYILPPLSLLNLPSNKGLKENQASLEKNATKLIEILTSFGVEARIIDYTMGPTVTRYEIRPGVGVKISKIENLADDIALKLGVAAVRISAVPEKEAVGIETPNKKAATVGIRELIGHPDFVKFPSKLAFALGKDIAGTPVIVDIARMPHLLVAGATGSGKSVCINTLITSILYKAHPDEVKMILVDPKEVELGRYNGIPHLLIPVVTNPAKAAGALQWAVKEMGDRYKKLADLNVRNVKDYNTEADKQGKERLPQIVIVIDELADLMMVAPADVEVSICRLAQLARAAGMHLVIATQRPSVDVVTGKIKANVPSRIAFAVKQQVDSRTILDTIGAEKLLGKGDMLFSPIGATKATRLQGPFVSDDEVEKIISFIKGQTEEHEYDPNVLEDIDNFEVGSGTASVYNEERPEGKADELLPKAIEMAIEEGQASVAMYQRKLKVGYQRAAKLIDQMEARGIIGPFEGTKPRQVLITRAQFTEMFVNDNVE
ncbi:MAG: DNA translocase FtsK 4TM domain-containing protein [Eubacteriales bacterium]|nr:DNA translocase FtsK 4TM domain-containing protein [Eubacteriales bacterium]